MRRHRILVGSWLIWGLAMVGGYFFRWLLLLLLGGTVLSIRTYHVLTQVHAPLKLRPRWIFPYRAIAVLFAVSGAAGVFACVQGVTFDARYAGNAAYACMFLLAGICGLRALVVPSPRTMAAAAMVFHAALVVGEMVNSELGLTTRWVGSFVPFYPMVVLVLGTAACGIAALLAFTEDRVPEAKASYT